MPMRRYITAMAVVALLLPSQPVEGRRGDAVIEAVRLTRGVDGDLLLAFRVAKALDERVFDTLDSGLPVQFVYLIRVERPRDFAPDKVLVDRRLVRVLEKDNLKDRYQVTLEGRSEARDFSSLEEAIEVMTRVEAVSLLPLADLSRRRPQFLRIKAQLQKFQLPFRLHYLFAFVSYLDVETDWYSVELPASAEALP